MMLPPIYAALVGDSSVLGIVDTRIWRHGDAPQDVSRPYVTWDASIAPENTLSELPGIDRVTVTINCWSLDDSEVEALATAVRDAIEPHAHLISMPVDNRDRPNTALYRMALQFDWWLPRAP